MFIDFMPLVVAIVVITTGPLVIGLVLRLFGLRLPARIAAALSIAICLAFALMIELQGGDGWIFVVVQLLLAGVLWVASPLKARTLTGEPPAPEGDTPPT